MALDLEPIKKRLAAATPGPWEFHVLPQPVGITSATIHSEHGPRETCWTVDLPPEIGGMGTEKDAEFIAHAPSDLAALLDEVDELRVKLEFAEFQIEEVKTLHKPERLYESEENCPHTGKRNSESENHVDDFHIGSSDGYTICLAMPTKEQICASCREDDGSEVEYPCPTIRALDGEVECDES